MLCLRLKYVFILGLLPHLINLQWPGRTSAPSDINIFADKSLTETAPFLTKRIVGIVIG